MKSCFIVGQMNKIFEREIWQRLLSALQSLARIGITRFFIGVRGEFERGAIPLLAKWQKLFKNIKIDVVYNNNCPYPKLVAGEVAHLPIDEEAKFQSMCDNVEMQTIAWCDTLLCVAPTTKPDQHIQKALNYAKKLNKQVFNLFDPQEFDDLTTLLGIGILKPRKKGEGK